MHQLRDAQLPRALEMLEALAARKSPLTLDATRLAFILGRVLSTLASVNGLAHATEEETTGRALDYLLGTLAPVLLALDVSAEELQPIMNSIGRDVADFRRSAP